MGGRRFCLCLVCCLSVLLLLVREIEGDATASKFPKDFLFGVASSAYQIEGGHDEDGKGENMWDYFTKHRSSKFRNLENGNVACDSYHKFKEDVALIKNLGVQFYRFSISWSRILPGGYSNSVNKEGLRYYNDLINELIANGIQPMVTMYHYDLPLPLHEIGGWTNPNLANYFEDYAKILYANFGDRVKYWITINGGTSGYGDDYFAPFINQPGIANYLCNHVVLQAHAKAYHLYDNHFRASQKGKVGITLDSRWYEPGSTAAEDVEAAERVREFQIGIMANPIFHPDGNYPKVVRERVDYLSSQEGFLKSRLPALSPREVEYIQGTYDFLGLNMYTSFYVKDSQEDLTAPPSIKKDMREETYQDKSWPKSASVWLTVAPFGLRKVLKWIKDKYDDPDVIITENGFSDKGELNDTNRIKYYQKYMGSLLEAIHEDKVSVKGYAAWSLLDNFEWVMGYSEKFGLHHVDFTDPDRKRTPKRSAEWYKRVVKDRRIVGLEEIPTEEK